MQNPEEISGQGYSILLAKNEYASLPEKNYSG
jgi:hypothetical protein